MTREVKAPCGCRRVRYDDERPWTNRASDYPCDAHINDGEWIDVLLAAEGPHGEHLTAVEGAERSDLAAGIAASIKRAAEIVAGAERAAIRNALSNPRPIERTCICGHRVDEHGEDGYTVKEDKPDGTCECHRDPTSQGSSRIITVPTVAALVHMTPTEIAEEMEGYAALGCGDNSHSGADELLCRIAEAWGYGDAARVFREMPRWTS